jgi:hypothetical protein
MSRDDFYASPFGVAYSAYAERPWLNRLIAMTVWGGDTRRYWSRQRESSSQAVGSSARLSSAAATACGSG